MIIHTYRKAKEKSSLSYMYLVTYFLLSPTTQAEPRSYINHLMCIYYHKPKGLETHLIYSANFLYDEHLVPFDLT